MSRRAGRRRRGLVVALVLVAWALLALACGTRKKNADPAAAPIQLRDDSKGLLLTWIDEKGDFHTELDPKDVPLVGRDAVRVVDPGKDEGTHDGKIFLADMRAPKPDGTYTVRVTTKIEFDGIAVARRQKRGPTLADAKPDAGAAPRTGGPGPADDNLTPVIIYGAPWCGPCHEAADYLRKKGIRYVEKNIDDDAAAAVEMKAKLRKAGYPSGSIPVLDVRGKILVGFNPRAVDEALGRAT